MSYAQAIEQLYALGHELAQQSGAASSGPVSAASPVPADHGPRRKFNLEQMRLLMAALGHPERRFRSVLIAGTNGKGSTAAMLSSIVQAAGYRVGLYTSPHLSRVNERMQIDGATISDDDFGGLYFRVDEAGAQLLREGALPQHPSFFEMMTAVGFMYFAEHGVDLAVLEAGMGGRLDATNIVDPMLSIITDISLDHTEWLGTTIDAIAREKAGILRPNGILVTLPQHPQANQALGEVATALGVRGINAAEYMPASHPSHSAADGATYSIAIQNHPVEIALPLAGDHQHRNAALAIAAAVELCNQYSYTIGPNHIKEGIRGTRWPGRLELFPPTESRCAVLLDAAHNPAGAWSLRSALREKADDSANARKTLLFGCLRDKAYAEMAQILFPIFDRVVLAPVDSPRSVAVEDLLPVAERVGVPATIAISPAAGFETALRQTPKDGLLVCAGSIYLIGSARAALVERGEK